MNKLSRSVLSNNLKMNCVKQPIITIGGDLDGDLLQLKSIPYSINPGRHICVTLDYSGSMTRNLPYMLNVVELLFNALLLGQCDVKISIVCFGSTTVEVDKEIQFKSKLDVEAVMTKLRMQQQLGGTMYSLALRKSLATGADCILFVSDGDPQDPDSYKIPDNIPVACIGLNSRVMSTTALEQLSDGRGWCHIIDMKQEISLIHNVIGNLIGNLIDVKYLIHINPGSLILQMSGIPDKDGYYRLRPETQAISVEKCEPMNKVSLRIFPIGGNQIHEEYSVDLTYDLLSPDDLSTLNQLREDYDAQKTIIDARNLLMAGKSVEAKAHLQKKKYKDFDIQKQIDQLVLNDGNLSNLRCTSSVRAVSMRSTSQSASQIVDNMTEMPIHTLSMSSGGSPSPSPHLCFNSLTSQSSSISSPRFTFTTSSMPPPIQITGLPLVRSSGSIDHVCKSTHNKRGAEKSDFQNPKKRKS